MTNIEGAEVLSLEDIALLDVKAPRTRTSGARKAVNTNKRDFETWFKLNTTFGVCENPNCVDKRPRKVEEGNAMTAVVEKKRMCRPCFLAGFGL